MMAPPIRSTGPSPRVRGSPAGPPCRQVGPGSIPACAGKPASSRRRGPRPQVHPRVCGEARELARHRAYASGPSPRVRGSRQLDELGLLLLGSIPRVCGEAGMCRIPQSFGEGPSPRVRGSPQRPVQRPERGGSIPACAGKPRSCPWPRAPSRVHPRVCGEAAAISGQRETVTGPSPRVRGSRVGVLASRVEVGSIPACAGKPRGGARPGRRHGVHPRVCGEAAIPTLRH